MPFSFFRSTGGRVPLAQGRHHAGRDLRVLLRLPRKHITTLLPSQAAVIRETCGHALKDLNRFSRTPCYLPSVLFAVCPRSRWNMLKLCFVTRALGSWQAAEMLSTSSLPTCNGSQSYGEATCHCFIRLPSVPCMSRRGQESDGSPKGLISRWISM